METLLPLLAFVVASTCTPGPNNLMILASGATFGLQRTVPHILGIVIGFPLMIVAVGLGLSAVFEALPWLNRVLQYVAFAYLCWLAWRIATAGRPQETGGVSGRPLTALEAAAFQWVNPKAWSLVLGVTALFMGTGGSRIGSVVLIAALFGLAGIPNAFAWAAFGRVISRFLAEERRRRAFNIAMAVLLVASALPAVY